VISHSHPNAVELAVELRISNSEVGIRSMHPPAAEVQRLPASYENLKTASGPCSEIQTRRVTRRQVRICKNRASSHFEVRRRPAEIMTGIPMQDYRFKAASMHLLRLCCCDKRSQIDSELCHTAAPTPRNSCPMTLPRNTPAVEMRASLNESVFSSPVAIAPHGLISHRSWLVEASWAAALEIMQQNPRISEGPQLGNCPYESFLLLRHLGSNLGVEGLEVAQKK